jgi:mannose-1-phosphate guanylyltransferase/phosphomannomutase
LHSAIDGLFAVGKLLELLALRQTRLSQVVAELPPFYIGMTQVEVSWEDKGRAMRRLLEHFAHYRHQVLDGVKIHLDDQRWVLMRPDADKALFHIIAEGSTQTEADALAAEHGATVRTLVQG